MNVSIVKKLVETQNIDLLVEAEKALIKDLPMPIEIEGTDESQQLTHAIAAIWILERIQESQTDFTTAFNEYIRQVRETIN